MKQTEVVELSKGSLKEPCKAGVPMMYHRDLWEALGGKDKLAFPCSQVLPTDFLSYPYPLQPRRSLRLNLCLSVCCRRQSVSQKTVCARLRRSAAN